MNPFSLVSINSLRKLNMSMVELQVGYEPANLTVHPPPELPRVGSFFSYRCLVFPKKCPPGKPVLFGIIEVKRPKNVVFHYIHSNQILVNLK